MTYASSKGEYDAVVVAAFMSILKTFPNAESVTEEVIGMSLQMSKISFGEVLDGEEVEKFFCKDLAFIRDHYWEVLHDKKNRRKREEIIRGALR